MRFLFKTDYAQEEGEDVTFVPLLDPDAQGFWSLAVEPPLLVLLAGVLDSLRARRATLVNVDATVICQASSQRKLCRSTRMRISSVTARLGWVSLSWTAAFFASPRNCPSAS